MHNQLISSTLIRLWKSLEDALANDGFESRRPDQRSFAFRAFRAVEDPEGKTMKFRYCRWWSRYGRLEPLWPRRLNRHRLPTATAPQTVAPSPTPESQETPQLLPESKTLPAQPPEAALPRDLIPEGTQRRRSRVLSQIRLLQNRSRRIRSGFDSFGQLHYVTRTRAISGDEPGSEPTDEMKREYLRVYYITMCDEMRKLEPRLKLMIDTFERANRGRLSQVALRPTVPERDVPRFEASQNQPK